MKTILRLSSPIWASTLQVKLSDYNWIHNEFLPFEWRCNVDGAGVEIRARIGQMRVYPVGPGDLHVGRSALDRFSRDPSAVISIDPTMNHTFFYLPKYA